MSLLVVFDLDGTLVDSRRDIVCATNFALTQLGRGALPDDVVTGFIGDGARTLMSRATAIEEADPSLEPYLSAFLDYYSDHALVHSRPLPGALAVLATLGEGLPIALCTNKPRRTTLRVLAGLGMRACFTAIEAGGDRPQKKPHPAPLLALAERLGFSPGRVVMVGDGPQDVACARAAGARSVGVLGNIATPTALRAAEPDALLANLGELPALLHRWRAQATSKW